MVWAITSKLAPKVTILAVISDHISSLQCKDCQTPDLQIIPSPANITIVYTLGNLLGFYHKTKFVMFCDVLRRFEIVWDV